MKHLQKHFSASLIALAALLTAAPIGAWAATAPSLGTASGFAMLGVGTANPPSTAADATTAVTVTTSTINGDVGSAGALTLTGSTINGNLVYSGALTNTGSTFSGTSTPLPIRVIKDFNTAYKALAPIPGECNTTNTLTGTLDGQIVTPGVYCVDSVAKAGTLTLRGPSNGVWIFKVLAIPQTPTLTGALTGTNFSVVMNGGGNVCNVTWWVAEAATMTKTTTTPGFFQGTILAGAAITMTGVAGSPASASFNGDALAKAAVTMKDVTITSCGATPPPPPTCDKNHKHDKHCDGDHDGHDGDHDGHDGDHDGHDSDNHNNPFGSNDEHGDKGDK